MSDFSKTIAELTPAQQELLRLRLGQVNRGRGGGGGPAHSPIKRRSRDGVGFPLSFAQQRLWFIDQLAPGSAAYNIPLAVRLTGRLDARALARSLDEIVRRHEILRTTFADEGGQPVQVVAPWGAQELEVVDLSPLGAEGREAAALSQVAEEARTPFDLARGPLARVRLLRLAAEEHVLLRTIHHIISDKLSQDIFVRELLALYAAFDAGRPSPLPELPIQYADYAAWQREWLRGEVLESQVSYWKSRLAGAPPSLDLPTDRPRPAVQTFQGAKRRFDVPQTLLADLEALSRREGATLFMTLLAAFKLLLRRHANQEDILVGTATSGRCRPEVEPLIGFFANTLVLRTDLSGDPSFGALLGRVRETMLGAEAHQFVPFERLVEELVVERDASRQPLFQVLFNFQTSHADSAELPGLTFDLVEADSGASKFDLTIFLIKTPHGLEGSAVYSTDLFDAGRIERLTRDYVALLRAAVARPGDSLGELLRALAEETSNEQRDALAALKQSNLQRLKAIRRKGGNGAGGDGDE